LGERGADCGAGDANATLTQIHESCSTGREDIAKRDRLVKLEKNPAPATEVEENKKGAEAFVARLSKKNLI